MKTRSTVLALALVAAAGSAAALAGPLDPPVGPIASTYKTLTEVEPRTAINATNTPGDFNSVFRITQPGSYYLTGNVAGAGGKSGIEIAADNVTIDLMGFSVEGVGGSLDGITTDLTRNNLTVRNGTISGWAQDGIDLTQGGTGLGSLVEGVTASNNTVSGIHVNDNAVVRSCVVTANGQDGITAPTNAAIDGCSAYQNGSTGILVGAGGTITNCTARRNIIGFVVSQYSTISNCSALINTFHGIYADLGNTILDCTSTDNGENGITAVSRNVVRGNTSNSNTSGAGISIGGSNNRIEGNNCVANDRGVRCTAGLNFITQNTASGNTTANWDISAGNKCLVVNGANAGAIFGNSGGVSPGSTDPNANYSY